MRRKYVVRNCKIDEKNLTLQETIFHNANGYIGVRGNLEEGYPEGMDTMRGTYLNGFYDIAPMKQAEKLCNLVEDKESMVNAADTQTINTCFNGQHFSLFEGEVTEYVRTLDMEAGITSRKVCWKSPDSKQIDFSITRMTSFAMTALFTIDYQFTPLDFEGTVEIVSLHKALVQNYFNPRDPRLAGESHNHLKKKDAFLENGESYLTSETIMSNLQVTSGVAHEVYVNGIKQSDPVVEYSEQEHSASCKIKLELKPGDTVRIVKYCIFRDSIRNTDCVKEARKLMQEVLTQGIDHYYIEQRNYLEKFWQNSSMEIEGDDDMDSSVSFNMYELLQAAGTDGYSSIAAKGLSGEGYEGHYFWDTEMFMLPYFTLTNPRIARNLLNYRYMTLSQAKENAALLGHKKGALYPWRTIAGKECSGYFPSGTAQYHIDGDIAYAVVLYYLCTGDWEFIKEKGLEILIETGRLWIEVGNYYEDSFRINCVTGPDEYTCMVNNNYYTNAAAKYNLEWILRFTEKFRREEDQWKAFREKIQLSEEELTAMEEAAEKMYLPYDEKLGINPQDDSFLQKPVWDLEKTEPDKFPLLLHYHPLHLYRYQVCKQADTVLAHILFPDYQDKETARKSFLYYEKVTTHDSSLSTCVFSIAASMLGMKEKAYIYLGDSAKMDLLNTHKNTKDGIHAANMGGCYMAVVNGFAMLKIREKDFSISPWLPKQWDGYSFRFNYHENLIEVCVDKEVCSLKMLKGTRVEVQFYGTDCCLRTGEEIRKSMKEQKCEMLLNESC